MSKGMENYSDAHIVRSSVDKIVNNESYRPGGSTITHITSKITNWRSIAAMDSRSDRAERLKNSPEAFNNPIRIEPAANQMSRVFNNYESFKRDLSPGSSKGDYGHFLDNLTVNKNSYDSNMSQTIEYNKRIIAYRNKEQVLRTLALRVNPDQDKAQKDSIGQIKLRKALQQQALEDPSFKAQHERTNYNRSPVNFVSL
jgi:hypothetical protein